MLSLRWNALLSAVALAVFAPQLAAQTEVLISAAADNTLYEDLSGGVSNGAGAGFFAGRPFAGTIQRGAIRFDVAASVPAGMAIVSARLELTMDRSIVGPFNFSLHRFNASWGEGASTGSMGGGGGGPAANNDVTWLHRFYPGTLWINAGGDFAAAASATTLVDMTGRYTWSSTALKADVQDMLDQPGLNHGWMMRGDESVLGTAKRFVTREGTNASQRPVLRVSYGPRASVASQGLGCGRGPLSLSAIGLPTLGNAGFALAFANGQPNAPLALYAAASFFPNGFPYSPSCKLELDPLSLFLLLNAGLDGAGTLTLPIPIPFDPALAGAPVALQGFALELGFESGVVGSNALRVVPGF
ncbi:MAG: DNRLRE domain-containing protein [Planctomycetes bacterium]|nr:DNRLRE domain-containing protein [Planctomycetota bacterium]